jgi:hypothetical protein
VVSTQEYNKVLGGNFFFFFFFLRNSTEFIIAGISTKRKTY